MFSRRLLTRIALCLVLGAVTTVAVAWGGAIFVDPQPFSGGPAPTDESACVVSPEWWSIIRWETSFSTTIYSHREPRPDPLDVPTSRHPMALVPYWSDLSTPTPSYAALPVQELRQQIAWGWPWRSLRNEFDLRGTVTNAIFLSQGDATRAVPIALPVQPIAVGFTADTFVYSLIWLGLALALMKLRRSIRRVPNHCPMCNYDLRGNPEGTSGGGCPECGWNREASSS